MYSLSTLTRSSASCEDLLSCLHNLSPAELDAFYELAIMRTASVDELSERLERDRTTIHRCLSKLVSVGLCHKETKTLKDGGYYHVYTATEIQEIKDEARMRVQELARSLQRLVDNFDTDFQKALRQRNSKRKAHSSVGD